MYNGGRRVKYGWIRLGAEPPTPWLWMNDFPSCPSFSCEVPSQGVHNSGANGKPEGRSCGFKSFFCGPGSVAHWSSARSTCGRTWV